MTFFSKKYTLLKSWLAACLLALCLITIPEKAATQPPAVFPRENIYTFINQPARIDALTRGIRVMKQRPASNPTSWAFQSNIHGVNSTANPNWNQCQHRHWWFLAWHRAYLYYMERMLQRASGESRLRIPYWNYTAANARALPPVFLNTTSDLYVPGRLLRNSTDELSPSAVSITTAMSRINFIGSNAQGGFGGGRENAPIQFPFENKAGSLETLPHNAIHVQVGGIMQNPRTAATDPVFWIHHSNIDRLWETWLRSGQNRTNPTETAFLNATFRLYNENGVLVTHRVRDFLVDTRQLGYYYDILPPTTIAAASADTLQAQQAVPPAATEDVTVETLAQTQLARPAEVLVAPVTLPIQSNFQAANINLLSRRGVLPADQSARVLLVLDDMQFATPPTNIYNVYLNLPTADFTTTSETKYFVGVLSFFEPDHSGAHGHMAQRKLSDSFDITDIVTSLQKDQTLDPENLTVTIVPIGVMRRGKPTLPENPVPLQINRVKIVTVQPRQFKPKQTQPSNAW